MMDLVKKNIPIILCVLIALGAIIADFFPLGGMRGELQQKVTARAAEYGALDSMLSKSRTLPIIEPGASEARPLEVFPTEAVIAAGEAVTQQIAASSEALLENVVKRTERPPLVPGALPAPQFVQADAFKQQYKRITDMSPQGRDNSLPVRVMRAGFAPTSEDLNRRAAEVTQRVQANVAIVANGQVTNQEQVQSMISAELATLQDRMIREVAEKCLVYINADTMDVQTTLVNTAGQPEPSVIFFAQLGLWVQEDLFQGIRQVNEGAGASNVGTAPIKHLIKVDVIEQFIGMSGAASADPNNPAPPLSNDPSAPLTPNYSVTPSGRVSNGLFDVIHMNVVMVVEADRLPMVLDQLGRGRLLSVIRVDRIEPMDTAAAANAGYFFGNKPCVRVEMVVEDLLLRKWTEPLMPEAIKSALGIQSPPPPG